MSSSYDATTAYDSLDDSTYDIFNLDAYCNLFSPPVPSPESVPNTPVPGPRLKRYPKTHGHPRPSPAVVPSSVIASASTQPPSVPAQPDKGKGHQCPVPPTSPTGPVDSQSSVSTDSVDLTPEQHLCLVRVLKRLDEWFAQGWEPGVDKSRLQALAEVFNSAESVAEGSLSNIHRADLAWRLSDSEGWEKSAGSSIMGAIDIPVTITKILFKDYGEPLIVSFRSFLGQKEAELGDSGCPSSILGPPLSKETSQGDSKPDVPKRVRFQGLDSAIRGACDVHSEWDEGSRLSASVAVTHVLTYDEACRGLAQHLAFISGTTYRQWLDFLFTLFRSLTTRFPPSSLTTNYATFSQVVDASPTPTPLEDFNAFGATPLDIGLPTMTELMDQFMEDQLTREFCLVVLTEDS
ncbi:hypothetical protein SCLCIDRAFT_29633 [Scleroderma citrinum Foug A]|uniref:Uncharacterized protein n=1 Tax=Scleroderma citrinum Foug A TaxID=1036808 RepID=A0A0C2ZV68_9AGAM|nr:hypothetical protein SCLCIDRAFT_29633 [Scleroderma citrinum Foug A]